MNIKLDSRAGDRMLAATRANLGKPMAVVYIEKRRETTEVDGKKVTRDVTDEKVINNATIQGVFGNPVPDLRADDRRVPGSGAAAAGRLAVGADLSGR